jgi:hypothetical protein
MKTKTENPEEIFSMRTKKKFIELCKMHSDKFEKKPSISTGSAAHFLKLAAREKLIKIGVPIKYIDSVI